MKPILFESHSHTPLCNHATGDPTEYAAEAARCGLAGIIVTCHNPMPDGFSARVRMREDEFDQYVELVAAASMQWQDRIEVRLGLEADYFEGHEPYLERQLNSADFHFVLGSVHPQIDEFRARYWTDDPFDVQRIYFRLLAQAAETGLFDSLAHPDLIKNFTSDHWKPELIWDDIMDSLDRIARTGVAMELNTSGLLKTIPEMNPFPLMLCEIAKRSIPITLGADAHVPERVGANFSDALRLLQASGFDSVSVFHHRQPKQVGIPDALASLSSRDEVAAAGH